MKGTVKVIYEAILSNGKIASWISIKNKNLQTEFLKAFSVWNLISSMYVIFVGLAEIITGLAHELGKWVILLWAGLGPFPSSLDRGGHC